MANGVELVPISKLQPHPDNPRLFVREEVVNGISEQIKTRGFEERHAPNVRQIGDAGFYQIVSGHQRIEAAKRAELEKIPCIVVELTDEEAFRELLLSNAQADLKPLEIGLHVLKATERGGTGGRGKKGGASEYARGMGIEQRTLADYVLAAKVFEKWGKPSAQALGLLDSMKSLSIIHRAPESDWRDLVDRMLAGGWTKEQTERYIEVIKSLSVPDDLSEIFPRPVLISRFFETHEFSKATLEAIIRLVRATEDTLRSSAQVDVEAMIIEFRSWLKERAERALDRREILRHQKELLQQLETADTDAQKRWNHGNWRSFIQELPDESVALALTDPPYGMAYRKQSRRRAGRPSRNRK
jgi:hypothetical protein